MFVFYFNSAERWIKLYIMQGVAETYSDKNRNFSETT